MLFLNKRLTDLGDKNTSETKSIKEEIEIIDNKVNELVYSIYGITNEEKKVIEDSLVQK